jgi:hypothetical protein
MSRILQMLAVTLMVGNVIQLSEAQNRKWYQSQEKDGKLNFQVVNYIEPPKERLERKMEKMAVLMKDTKLSFQLLCVAAQCLVVEVPLAGAIQIMILAYSFTEEWPLLAFLVMMLYWIYVCTRVKKAWDYYTSPTSTASSSDDVKIEPVSWRTWLFGGAEKTTPWTPAAVHQAVHEMNNTPAQSGVTPDQALYGRPPPTAPRREPCWHCGMEAPDHRGEDCEMNPRRRNLAPAPVNVTVMAPDNQQETVRRVVREELGQAVVSPATPMALAVGDEILERRQQAGKRFSEVYATVPDYVTYILQNTRLKDQQLNRFKDYCLFRRQQEASARTTATSSSGRG